MSSTKFMFFGADWENKDGYYGFWLAETFSTSPLKTGLEFNKTWQEARTQRPLPSLCFLGQLEDKDGHLTSD